MKKRIGFHVMAITILALSLGLMGAVCEDDNKDNSGMLAILAANIWVNVPGGTDFSMGYAPFEPYAEPVHTVDSVSSFSMSKYELTYDLFYKVKTWAVTDRGDGKRKDGGALYTFQSSGKEGHDGASGTPTEASQEPVTTLTWCDAIAWCNAYSEKKGLTPCYYNSGQAHTTDNVYRDAATGVIGNSDVEWDAAGYRLPTELEWEYAARYIDGSTFLRGDAPSGWIDTDSDSVVDDNERQATGWDPDNSDGGTHPVGQKQPNALGIYDMYGNVSEWCWDRFAYIDTTTPWYAGYTDADTRGPDSGTNRVDRGGSYAPGMGDASARNSNSPTATMAICMGFRLVKK